MNATWEPTATGVLRLPSGVLVRGRGLRNPLPDGPKPDFALYLLGRRPAPVEWETRWVCWPDLSLPRDRPALVDALRAALEHARTARVEIACYRGFGRTATALACLAVLDGIPSDKAVAYVRENYSRWTLLTPWQARFVARFHETSSDTTRT